MAQLSPADGSQLNYRLVGFSFPFVPGAGQYRLEVAEGDHSSEANFSKHIIEKVPTSSGRVIIMVPFFGHDYTWRVLSVDKRSKATSSKFHHFSTLQIPEVDSTLYRLNITKQAKTYEDATVFVDASRTLSDMQGRPVWFLPAIEGNMRQPRDLKLSQRGTITFLIDDKAYEVNYNGEILWKAPRKGSISGDSIERYHHEITRLKNGHYMTLGNEKALLKLPSKDDSNMRFMAYDKKYDDNKASYLPASLGTVIEYDEQGKVVWSWKSSVFFSGTIVAPYKNMTGNQRPNTDVHQNAFYFDETTNYIYVSFKNINRILKVKYPEGIVAGEYGAVYSGATQLKDKDLFCAQHCCGLTQKGYLFTFDNNDCDPVAAPKLLMMQEPADSKGPLKIVWEYEFPLQKVPEYKEVKFKASSGGNIIELPDQSVFAMLSDKECQVFIVSPDKEVLWSAVPQKWNADTKRWEAVNNSYRASIIPDRRSLEKLVWSVK